MVKSQQYSELLQKLFNPSDKSLRIDLSILKQICQSQDYRRLIDVTGILLKLFWQEGNIFQLDNQMASRSIQHLAIILTHKIRMVRLIFLLMLLVLKNQISSQMNFNKSEKIEVYDIFDQLSQILEMLKNNLNQIRVPNQKKEEQLLFRRRGDHRRIQKSSNQQHYQRKSSTQIGIILQIFKPNLQGKFSNTSTLIKFIAVEIIRHLQKIILFIPLTNHTERKGEISRALNCIHHSYIIQYQIEVEISKNTLAETRIYNNKLQRQLLFRHQKQIVKSIRKILNEAIFCPSSMSIQILLLRIIRRFYCFGIIPIPSHHRIFRA